MIYICQRDYPHIPYLYEPTDDQPLREMTVASSGCGICSLCMVVESLTTRHLDVRDCLELAESVKATTRTGTSLVKLGPVAAEKYGLVYAATSDRQELVNHLSMGGMAIALVKPGEGQEECFYAKSGHYVVVVSFDGEDVCILDPNYSQEKYAVPFRAERIRVEPPFLYSDMDALMDSTNHGKTRFHLFARKKP